MKGRDVSRDDVMGLKMNTCLSTAPICRTLSPTDSLLVLSTKVGNQAFARNWWIHVSGGDMTKRCIGDTRMVTWKGGLKGRAKWPTPYLRGLVEHFPESSAVAFCCSSKSGTTKMSLQNGTTKENRKKEYMFSANTIWCVPDPRQRLRRACHASPSVRAASFWPPVASVGLAAASVRLAVALPLP